MSKSCNINNILYIGILIVIVLLVCFRCISLQNNIQEQFADASAADELNNAVSTNNSIEEANRKNRQVDSDSIAGLTSKEREDLVTKCAALNLENQPWGSIIAKYSGKTINVDHVGENDRKEKTYIIKWQPVGGKPGGCITLEANGTYSTPLCNPNTQIMKQLWTISKFTNEDQIVEALTKANRKGLGRPIEETTFPFYLVRSQSDPNYVLNYEGGSLSVRRIGNYDSQKWEVDTKKIPQDPLPTHNSNKFAGLNPDHNASHTDGAISNLNTNANTNTNTNTNGSSNKGDGAVNLNVNLDPDLLSKLGLVIGTDGNLENLNENLNNKKQTNNDLLIGGDEPNITGGRGDVSDMLEKGANNPNCSSCKLPEKYIKKDLVKSMCIGCDNIDNVLT